MKLVGSPRKPGPIQRVRQGHRQRRRQKFAGMVQVAEELAHEMVVGVLDQHRLPPAALMLIIFQSTPVILLSSEPEPCVLSRL